MKQHPSSAFRTSEAPSDTTATRRAAFDPQMKPLYIVLALGWAALLIGLPLVDLSVDIPLTIAFLVVCGLGSWLAACLRLRGFARTATAIEAWTLLSLSCLTGILGTYVVARFGRPFADSWMVSADRLILPGLDWKRTVFAVAHDPLLVGIANRAYGTLAWQGSVLILLCCVTGHADRCAAFVLRWTIALALVVAVFALLPCNGPTTAYAITHAQVPAIGSNAGWCARGLQAWLRSTGPIRLDLSALDGIVTFPSFHAAAAVLFAWGFWAIRWARWPMLALNLAMIAATVPIGGHYYSDVLAGIVIAGTSIALPGLLAQHAAKVRPPAQARVAQ
jgi:membrane-associated phospholipid phosphatase